MINPITLIAGAGAATIIGFAGGYGLRDLKADADAGKIAAAQLQAERAARAKEGAQALATYQTGLAFGQSMAKTREVYRTIREEVPNYVTPEIDARFPVPVGSVRLHDAAARGEKPVPDPSGKPNDATSGVTASAFADTVAGNYETCNATRDQLIGLQDWITQKIAPQ